VHRYKNLIHIFSRGIAELTSGTIAPEASMALQKDYAAIEKSYSEVVNGLESLYHR
jgi:hypothetical protein